MNLNINGTLSLKRTLTSTVYFDLHQGRQEDAEEFLGCVLDKLHEEMIAAKKAAVEEAKKGDNTTPSDGDKGRGSEEEGPKNADVEDDGGANEEGKGDDEWEQVGRKNRSTITRQVLCAQACTVHVYTCTFTCYCIRVCTSAC